MRKPVIVVLTSIVLLFSFQYCSQRGRNKTHPNGVTSVIDNFTFPAPVNAPFPFPDIKIPAIPDKKFNILDFGATEGGEVNCSIAIKDAIAEAAKQGGGIVVIPGGKWLTGPIHLESNINLHLEEGATLLFSQKFEDYLPTVLWRHEGIECYSFSPFIYAVDKENIAITGKGIFEGRGKAWWEYRQRNHQEYYRNAVRELRQMAKDGAPVEDRIFDGRGEKFICPPFLVPIHCRNVWIEGVTFRYGAFWTIVPTYCENVVVRNVTVKTSGTYGDTPNGDGINPCSSRNVLIENCILDTGDDCIAIKSGKDTDGRRINIPTENVVVRNVTGYRGHGGVVIGSEISGGIKNVYAYNCNFNGTDRMVRLKAARGRGGYVKNVWYENLKADTIEEEAIRLNLLYHGERLPEQPVDVTTPVFENIHIKNISCKYSKQNAIQILGIPEMKIRNVTIDSVSITSDKGIEIIDAHNIVLRNIQVLPHSTRLLAIDFSDSIFIEGLHTKESRDNSIPISINESQQIQIKNFTCTSAPDILVEIKGRLTGEILLDKKSFNISNITLKDDVRKENIKIE